MNEFFPGRVELTPAGQELVDEAATTFSCDYGGFKSNHSIHGIVSLYALGGTRNIGVRGEIQR